MSAILGSTAVQQRGLNQFSKPVYFYSLSCAWKDYAHRNSWPHFLLRVKVIPKSLVNLRGSCHFCAHSAFQKENDWCVFCPQLLSLSFWPLHLVHMKTFRPFKPWSEHPFDRLHLDEFLELNSLELNLRFTLIPASIEELWHLWHQMEEMSLLYPVFV